MYETLPTLEELKGMDDLSANTLYAIEVAHLPSVSLVDEQDLVRQARTGSEQACSDLILSILRYVLGKARAVYNLKPLAHDDLLDLVQVASLEMLNDLDRALQRDNPVSYLRGIGRRAIALYCSYRSSLVSKPTSLTQQMREKHGEVWVESLDAPVTIDGALIRLDFVEAPASDPTAFVEEESLEERRARFAVLYDALEALPARERLVLTLRFGLDGQSGMRRDVIGELIGGSYGRINWTENKALEHLRTALGVREAALVCSGPEKEA